MSFCGKNRKVIIFKSMCCVRAEAVRGSLKYSRLMEKTLCRILKRDPNANTRELRKSVKFLPLKQRLCDIQGMNIMSDQKDRMYGAA